MNKYLFLLCMNNCGSTVLMRFIDKCENAVGLGVEGHQLLSSELCPIPNDLDCEKIASEKREVFEAYGSYDWPGIKRAWNVRWKENPHWGTNGRVLTEKSPPNIWRAKMMERTFRNSHFIIMVRNPYAAIEGVNRRRGYSWERCAKHWLASHQTQKENVENLNRMIWFKYEDMIRLPEAIVSSISNFIPELHDMSFEGTIDGSSLDSSEEEVPLRTDLNEIHRKRMKPAAINEINSVLRKDEELLNYFGYELV